MSYPLNNITAPDSAPTAASTLEVGTVVFNRIVIDVANQAIYWQLKLLPGNWEGGSGQYMAPGSRVIKERCMGIRFWAAIPAASLPAGVQQAQVTIRAIDD